MEVDVMSARQRSATLLTAAGCSPVVLSHKEVSDWQRRWRAVFAKELHASTGKRVLKDLGRQDARQRCVTRSMIASSAPMGSTSSATVADQSPGSSIAAFIEIRARAPMT